jgi:hypothetical protein
VNAAWRNRIVGQGTEAPEQLLANPRNWRVHGKTQQAALNGVLDEVGWVQQILVNQRTGHVVDGHLRVTLALRRNEPTVPVIYVDLTEQEEALVLATLDPIGALAGTTIVAAEQLGRRCYALDISPAYCDVSVKRWENLTGRKATREKPSRKARRNGQAVEAHA